MALRMLMLLVGIMIIFLNIFSAIRTFVLPRSSPDIITKFVFSIIQRIFTLVIRLFPTYQQKDKILAYFAPIALLAMPPTWLFLISIGFSLIYYSAGTNNLVTAFSISGSSLLTLGFAKSELQYPILEFTQATLGPLLIALLISYLPTMYSAFHTREMSVNRLSVRAGIPPSPVQMLMRFHRLDRLPELSQFWEEWETWFAELEESHTSLAALVFFRSPQPEESWINAAGTVLDAAALRLSIIDLPDDIRDRYLANGNAIPSDARAAITIRAGFIALRRIADYFEVKYNPNPQFPNDKISITKKEFDQAYMILKDQGIPMIKNTDRAWKDFAGWRVNYDSVLTALKELTMAPDAPWLGRSFEN